MLVAVLALAVPIAATMTAAPADALTVAAGDAVSMTIAADGPAPSAGTVDTATDDAETATEMPSTTPNPATAANTAAKPCTGTSPAGSYGSTLAFTVSSITPQLVTSGGPAALTVTGTMTNTGDDPLTELGYKYQRGDALIGEAAIRKEATSPCQPIAVVNSGFVAVEGDLAAGASTTFVATVPIAGDPTRTLAVTDPGVYPLMINFNATVKLPSGDLRARVGEVHLLLTVLSVPPAPALPGAGSSDGTSASAPNDTSGDPGSATGATGSTSITSHPALPYSMVWTLVDRPHLGVGGVFLDDALVPAISPGGRLYQLLSTMTTIPQVAGANTLAIDPELLDELDRMSRGYWVISPPNTTQPALTPVTNGVSTSTATPTTTQSLGTGAAAVGSEAPGSTSASSTPAPPTTALESTDGTTADDLTSTAGSTPPTSSDATETPPGSQPPGTVAGSGQAAAADFLGRIRRLAATTAILVLPYSDPDAVALVRAGMSEYLSDSVYLGRAVAARVIGATVAAGGTSSLIDTIAYPMNGLADTATLSALAAVGDTGVILSAGGVTGLARGSSTTTLPVTSGSGSLAALVPNSSLVADITPFLSSGVPADDPTSLNLIAGVVAGQYFAGAGTPLLLAPGRTWVPDADGVAAIGSLLATFSSQGVVAGTDLRTLAADASGSAKVRYPATAKAKELPQTLLRRLAAAQTGITSLRVSTTAVEGPDGGDPDLVLDPLQESLTRVASASQRNNPSFADHVLSTVESSLRTIEAGVTVPTSGGSLTLASSSAPLRLTVRNSLPYDVRVTIIIGGGQRVGLTTTDPGVQDVPAGRSVPVTVRAHVARSGTFSITAQLMTVDGRRWGAPVTLQVNSRAYGGLTLVLLIVAGSVLALMVVIRIVQRMRARRRGRPGGPDGMGGSGGSGGSAATPGTSATTGETPLTALDPPADVMSVPEGRAP